MFYQRLADVNEFLVQCHYSVALRVLVVTCQRSIACRYIQFSWTFAVMPYLRGKGMFQCFSVTKSNITACLLFMDLAFSKPMCVFIDVVPVLFWWSHDYEIVGVCFVYLFFFFFYLSLSIIFLQNHDYVATCHILPQSSYFGACIHSQTTVRFSITTVDLFVVICLSLSTAITFHNNTIQYNTRDTIQCNQENKVIYFSK